MRARSVPRAAAGVFVLALAVRLAFVALVPGWSLAARDLYDDAPDFHAIATHLAAGDGYVKPWVRADPAETELRPTAFRAPLWPVALGALYAVTGPSPAAGRALNVVLDALTCALVVVLGARLASLRAGVAAGALAAVYPPLLAGVTQLMSEPLFTLTVVATLLACDAFRVRPGPGRAALVGASLGLGALARPNGLGLAALILVWLGWLAWRRRGAWLRPVAAAVAALGVVVAPWLVYTRVQMGAFVPVTTQGGSVLAGWYSPAMLDRSQPTWGTWDYPMVIEAYFRAPDELTWSRDLQRRGITWVRDHPAGALRLVGYHVLRYFDLYWELDGRTAAKVPSPFERFNAAVVLSWWLAAPLAVAGLLRLRRRRALGPMVPALLAAAALTASGVLLAAGTRYRAPMEPVVLLLVAAAVVPPRRGAAVVDGVATRVPVPEPLPA